MTTPARIREWSCPAPPSLLSSACSALAQCLLSVIASPSDTLLPSKQLSPRLCRSDPSVCQCSYRAALQNVGFMFLADGNGYDKGTVKWKCCNCSRDIKFGVSTLTVAEYNRTACWQCKYRPVQVIAEMRRQHAIDNPPVAWNERYGPPMSRKRMCVCFCVIFIVLVGSIAAFYFASGWQNRPVIQAPGKNATTWGMMPM